VAADVVAAAFTVGIMGGAIAWCLGAMADRGWFQT